MRHSAQILWVFAIFALSASLAVAATTPKDNSGSITIVFKDGHQHTYSMADISRIEFNTPAQASAAGMIGRGRFLGRWKVGDGMGSTFTITLDRDGNATKSLGSTQGTWTVVDGEARISWNDGWTDVLRLHGNRYEKVAYAPGKSVEDDASNVTNAEHVDRSPI